MTRVQTWPALLEAFIEARRQEPFSWGRNDCCLFAADWVQVAYGGHDPAAAYRGTYTSALGAIRHVKKLGSVAAMPTACGLELIEPTKAHRGDIAGVVTVLGMTIGVCLGEKVAAPARTGLIFLSRRGARHAWRV